jgi:Fe-S-cluster-containing dehydrogenase component
MDKHKNKFSDRITRRQFLKGASVLGIAAAGGTIFFPEKLIAAIPNSEGFLLVDMKKCQGCGTCMMACALAHTGAASYTLSRIQIQQDSFANWPDDVFMAICRQCKDAPCVEVCPVTPVKANKPNPKYGNVRMIDQKLCIGCKLCLTRCPYVPSRIQWDQNSGKSQKCDLCADTPYLGEKGGPGGVQTCIKVCPVNAITFSKTMPDQTDEESYNVNLRGPAWGKLGMTTD